MTGWKQKYLNLFLEMMHYKMKLTLGNDREYLEWDDFVNCWSEVKNESK